MAKGKLFEKFRRSITIIRDIFDLLENHWEEIKKLSEEIKEIKKKLKNKK